MPDVIKIAEATAGRKSRPFVLVDSTGAAITGATVTGRLLKDGVEGVAAGTFAEVSAVNRPGLYTYTPSTTEMASAGACLLRPIATGAVAAEWPFQIIGNDVYATSPTTTDVATAVWGNTTRTLSSFGTLVSDIWSNAARTLTDKLGFSLSSSQTFSTTGSVGSVTGAVGSVTGSVGSVAGAVATVTALGTQAKADVTAAVPTAAQNAAGLLDLAGSVKGTLSVRRWFEVVGAVLLGKVSGQDTNAPVFRELDDSADAVTSATDADGNRTSVTVTP